MFPLVESWQKSGLKQKEFGQKHELPLHFLPTGCQGTEKHDPGKQTPNQFLMHL
jgi:hypothetical protein